MESASPTRTLRRRPLQSPPFTPAVRSLSRTRSAPASTTSNATTTVRTTDCCALPSLPQEQVDAHAVEIAQMLRGLGTKLVCIDFDATFVHLHTGGTWSRSATELQRHVRPLFAALVPLLVRQCVAVAIVTFSPQTQLIRDVLALCFPPAIAQSLILRCDDASWTLAAHETLCFAPLWQTGGRQLDRTCKLPFVISAALQAATVRGESVCNRDTVLFDDDAANIRVVVDSGIAGVYFDAAAARADAIARLVQQIRRFQPVPTTATTTIEASVKTTMTTTATTVEAVAFVPVSPLQTPSKKQPTLRMVRLMASPESRFFAPPTPSSSSSTVGRLQNQQQLRQRGHGTGTNATTRVSRFHLCTPSPVTKLRSTVDMGRPRSKRSIRLMRKIESDLHEMHLPLGSGSGVGSGTVTTETTMTTTTTTTVTAIVSTHRLASSASSSSSTLRQSTPTKLLLRLEAVPEPAPIVEGNEEDDDAMSMERS